MEAMRLARGGTPPPPPPAPSEEQRVNPFVAQVVDQSAHARVVQRFADINWTEEEAREGVLNEWRRNRAFDGIFISQNDEAWRDLQQRARGEWDYQYENVLGGTGNTFGMEIEFEFPRDVSRRDVTKALYEAGILDRPQVYSYHGGGFRTGPGYFRLEEDGSLSNGLELVSPILFDNRESWEKIETATRVLREIGAKTNSRTGGHIHVGIAPLDHRAYSWQRLARIGVGYERNLYRMGAADNILWTRTGNPGRHRGTSFASPIPSAAFNISGESSAEAARRSFGGRRTIFNATNVDAAYYRKPTLEFRYPNSTLDHRQWQAQIQVANAIVHQAAVIRNESPQNQFTPGLEQRHKHLRYDNECSDQMEVDHFRKFLDVLGHEKDRFAAAWLHERGRV
ncbi:amidoligase family protein [Cohnella sp. GCM10020058]|uniref:amidoligase family protein n=1 Tax=Cohnella sp. GCM10020058 TaxID=3317330 RepID=UPI0036446824